jgi:hypothetical protein
MLKGKDARGHRESMCPVKAKAYAMRRKQAQAHAMRRKQAQAHAMRRKRSQ